jgi:hypothetical protein
MPICNNCEKFYYSSNTIRLDKLIIGRVCPECGVVTHNTGAVSDSVILEVSRKPVSSELPKQSTKKKTVITITIESTIKESWEEPDELNRQLHAAFYDVVEEFLHGDELEERILTNNKMETAVNEMSELGHVNIRMGVDE